MKKFVAKIWNSPSARNVGKLLSANVIAQAIGLLVYPVLTRMYTPEDFGVLSLFASISGVLIILSTLGYHEAIVLPKEEEDARAITVFSFSLIAATSLLLFFSIPFAGKIAGIFNSPTLENFYWLLPIYVLLSGIWNVLNYWFIRQKAYKQISSYQMSQSFFAAGYKLGFGLLGCLNGGLIFASVLAPLCSLSVTILSSAKKFFYMSLAWQKEKIRYVVVRYANFPKFSMPHSLINYTAGQLPVLLLTPFFSAHEVGLWSMAVTLSFVPLSMLTNALFQVLYQRVSEMVNAHRSIAQVHRSFTIIALSALLPLFIGAWFFLPSMVKLILGSEWRMTGIYIRWMLPWLLCVFLCGSVGYLYSIFFKQKYGLYFEIIIAVMRLLGLGLGIYYNNFALAVACYAVVSAIINGIQYIWLMNLVHKYEKSL